MDNAIDGNRGTLDLIDAQAAFYVNSEIGSNKNVVYKFLVIWGSIALVCDGSRVRVQRVGLRFACLLWKAS